ncbi:MAG: hypothetical protein AAGF20_00730 [Pseudomonadota bacterium]
MPFGFGLWNWFANNRYAQWIAGALGFLILWRLNNEYHEARGRRQEQRRAEKRARKQLEKLKEASREKLEKAHTARRDIRAPSRSNELPDDIRERFIRDR